MRKYYKFFGILLFAMGIAILYEVIVFPPPTTKLGALGFATGVVFSVPLILLGLMGFLGKKQK